MENIAYIDTAYTVLLHLGGALFIYSHMLSHHADTQADMEKKKLLKVIKNNNEEFERALNDAETKALEMFQCVHESARETAHKAHIESLKNLYGSQNLEKKLEKAGLGDASKSTKFLGLNHVFHRTDSKLYRLKSFFFASSGDMRK